ncbi:MAG: SDR family oxidoreductase [archaeon]
MPTVLLTGATGGIGTKIAHILAKHNFALILLSIEKEQLEILSSTLKKTYGAAVHTLHCNIADSADLSRTLSGITALDVLINCAGVTGPVGPFLENDLDAWKATFAVNLFGTAQACQLLIPLLRKARKGKIINFAGGGSAYPRRYHTAYACSKTAVVRFTETLAEEHPELTINVIAPGKHKTKMWDEQLHDEEPKTWADPVRLERFIIFLCTEQSDNITGRFLHLYDDWDKRSSAAYDKDLFTLRRIDAALIKSLEVHK